ncbi:MAG: IclR family transcriptional regulator [Thermodesulfobacteriota bacterium]
MPETKQINSIHRCVKVLEVLSQGVNQLESIYPRLGLGKSTTHRLLKSLAATGLAFQDPATRFYHLGPTLLRLASNPKVSHHMLVICAENELIRLNRITKETSLIFVPRGLQRLVVKEVPSTLDVSFSFKEGHSLPIYIGSAGKMMLSMMENDEFEAILRNIKLIRFGPNTITNKEVLRKEIDKIRKQGYSISFGETQAGTAGISVPIRNYVCPTALCIVGPEFRFSPVDALNELRESAHRVSNNLQECLHK